MEFIVNLTGYTAKTKGLASLTQLMLSEFATQRAGKDIGGGSGTASTATAVPKFDKWGLSRTKLGSEQFQYQPVLT